MDLGPLRDSRDLRLLFFGGTISFVGSMLTFVALPYQAYQLSHSSLVVGLLSLAELAPIVVMAFVGGALADAVDRRRMLRWTEAGMCLSSLALVVNAWSHHAQLSVLFAVAVVFASLDGLQRPCLDSMVPRLVTPEQLPATSAIMAVRGQIGMIAGPALTGVIIAVGGLPATYLLDAASYVVSLVFLLGLAATPPPAEADGLSLAAVREGLAYAWERKDLLGSYLVDINAMFFGMPSALFPQIAAHFGGASALGVLYAAPAAGSFLVTVTSGWAGRVRRNGRMIAIAACIWGAGILILGFAGSLWLAAVGLVVAGAGDMVSGLGRTTMWNQSIPDALRGRMAGIEMLSYSSGPALGDVEAGLVETLAGLRTSIVAGGIFSIVGSVVLSLCLPAFWRYDSEDGKRLRAPTGP